MIGRIAVVAAVAVAPVLLDGGSRGRAGRPRHRNLHRRKDHGAAHQLPAEQCRFPAKNHHQARRRPSAEARRRQSADRGLKATVAALQKTVDELQALAEKAAEEQKKKAEPPTAAKDAPAAKEGTK